MEKFGVWPNKMKRIPLPPNTEVLNWITHCHVTWAKSRNNPKNAGAAA